MATTMARPEDAQSEAAQVAARTRQAIAKKIATLVPKVEDDNEAQVVLHLAELILPSRPSQLVGREDCGVQLFGSLPPTCRFVIPVLGRRLAGGHVAEWICRASAAT